MFGLFKKRADPKCLHAAGIKTLALLSGSLRDFCSSRDISAERIDETIRKIVEAQMMVVSFSTSLFNYALTDAYYDAGMADPLRGMPDVKFDQEDHRRSLKEAWDGFSTAARMNLDMRYRYVLVQKLMSPGEEALWLEMERWSERKASRHFEMQQHLTSDWAAFIVALSEGEIDEARLILRDA